MNRKPTPQDFEEDDDLSHLDEDDAPELTPELAARLQPLEMVDPELAEFIRKGGRVELPEKYRKAVTVLLDDEVIEHFRVGEDGWMERVNAALRKAAGL